ncbi:hypothetical protein PL71_19070 [Pseudoalteromonas distincta]|uniref:Lipoprotein n=1 Tax=Pseudoalteromonas distincta TaxID=77608 RepID=A0ABT9GI24_9GAMM|nr:MULTISPECIES: hypothetical protein [Pseudoalteromonas distincta group]KHM44502.1 hypothetical protein PL71_19070 [Pseudoalteromonas elyakovii]KID39820.1 hypothetical protein QT16_06315 [Pseudoalteromonas distincta]MDP4485545.1 hypothetical protein [Pseudoalteromonas elyakovii]
MKHLLIALSILMLSACASTKSDFRFDGSTPESTQAGVNKVLKTLKSQDVMRFIGALITIQFSDVQSAEDVLGDPTMMNEMNYFIVGKKIDGLNYYEVLELASTSSSKVEVSVAK